MEQFTFFARRLLRRYGFDVVRDYGGPTARRMLFVARYNINLLFDVGANVGQYAIMMRQMGYAREIVSFEPLAEAFAELKAKAARDAHWQVIHSALGETAGTEKINVSSLNSFSSFLEITPMIAEVNRDSSVVAQQTIQIQRLDAIFDQYYRPGDSVLVKIDTQGFEPQVILGAQGVLEQICGFQLEMSLVPLYKGEMLLPEMVQFMRARGYTLVSIEPGYIDPRTGQMLQVDGLFMRL